MRLPLDEDVAAYLDKDDAAGKGTAAARSQTLGDPAKQQLVDRVPAGNPGNRLYRVSLL